MSKINNLQTETLLAKFVGELLYTCLHCGHVNRVQCKPLTDAVRCGRCKKRAFVDVVVCEVPTRVKTGVSAHPRIDTGDRETGWISTRRGVVKRAEELRGDERILYKRLGMIVVEMSNNSSSRVIEYQSRQRERYKRERESEATILQTGLPSLSGD